MLLHFDNSLSLSTLSLDIHTRIARLTLPYLLTETVAPSSKILLAIARVYSLHKCFVIVRALLNQRSISTFISKSLTQCLRLSRINRSVSIPALAKCSSSCVTLSKRYSGVSRRICLYYDRVYISINEIFIESSKYRI